MHRVRSVLTKTPSYWLFSYHATPINHRELYRMITKAFSSVPSPQSRPVAVALSGGVDSAVAALLLKQAGHDVIGIFMRNWDEAEETGNKNCSIEKDFQDAKAVSKQLSFPLYEADFVSQYWNDVFSNFLSECSRGLTPNPDLTCNRFIKFGALIDFAKKLGVDTVATGHYARLHRASQCSYLDKTTPRRSMAMDLLRGVDEKKDQSYFLASVNRDSFENILFPLGSYYKTNVRKIAEEHNLIPATKRSSAGICFIGRRNFSNFLSEYLSPIPGSFIDVDSGKNLGPCLDMLSVTTGQRPRLGGAPDRTYVVGKDMINKIVYTASGVHHPALQTRSACLRTPHWLSARHEALLLEGVALRCQYKARYSQVLKNCTIRLLQSVDDVSESTFYPSKYCVLHPKDQEVHPGYLFVRFDEEPGMAITPQQMFVMYDGELCLGSAPVAMPGRSVHELMKSEK